MIKLLQTNERAVDRVLRVIIGIGILSLTIVGPRTLWGLVGVVPLMTGLVGSCPIYSMFGISTCSLEKRPAATQR